MKDEAKPEETPTETRRKHQKPHQRRRRKPQKKQRNRLHQRQEIILRFCSGFCLQGLEWLVLVHSDSSQKEKIRDHRIFQ